MFKIYHYKTKQASYKSILHFTNQKLPSDRQIVTRIYHNKTKQASYKPYRLDKVVVSKRAG